jgi:hypothetical protein
MKITKNHAVHTKLRYFFSLSSDRIIEGNHSGLKSNRLTADHILRSSGHGERIVEQWDNTSAICIAYIYLNKANDSGDKYCTVFSFTLAAHDTG